MCVCIYGCVRARVSAGVRSFVRSFVRGTPLNRNLFYVFFAGDCVSSSISIVE